LVTAQLRTNCRRARLTWKRLGWPVRYFAYPYGESNGRIWAAVRAAGYRGAMNATGGIAGDPEKRWSAPRIEIGGTLSLDAFARYASQ